MPIDNILSNDLLGTTLTLSGILKTDISDHYPVFHNVDMSLSPKENLYKMLIDYREHYKVYGCTE